MLTRYTYSRHGVMYDLLYEVFHAVIQFTHYTFIYVRKYIQWMTAPPSTKDVGLKGEMIVKEKGMVGDEKTHYYDGRA